MEKYTLTNFEGQLLGFETDTVWGLGCLPGDEKAVARIYELKGRDTSKPLILMSNSVENLLPYVSYVPDYAKTLINKHFPGALTLIFKKSPLTKDFITSGKDTVGVRVPAHKGFQELCRQVEGHVLATTSLNLSNKPPVADFKEANACFGNKVNIIEPIGETPMGVASTVVLCTEEAPVVLRQGSIRL